MFPADWTEVGTKEELEKKIGNRFKVRLGWTESETDTVFCQETNHLERKYHVFVWNHTGIRMQMANVLGQRVYRI